MVLKISKGGVYSGNTLRASNSRYNRRYRTHCSIVKVLEEQFSSSLNQRKCQLKQAVDEFDITAPGVEFSLNKRKRWGLPAAIRKRIQYESVYGEGEVKTDLLVKHKLKRQANCVAFYSNMGKMRRLVPRAGRYFDGRSVTMSRRQAGDEVEKMKTSDDVIEEKEVPVESSVRYEVYIPCSPLSSIVHNPKYIKPEGRGKNVKKCRRKRRSRVSSRDVDEMLEFYDPRYDNDEDVLQVYSSDDSYEVNNSYGQFLLKDFLKPDRKRKRTSRRKSHRHCDDSGMNIPRVVNSTEEREHDMEEDSAEGSRVSIPVREPTHILPVAVKISTKETAVENLQTTYGQLYNEARCAPRKFTIDITNKVRALAKSKLLRDVPSSRLDLQCFLVFREGGPCPVDARFNIYDVSINFSSHAKSMKLETVIGLDTYSFAELETRSLNYISTLSRDLFVIRNISGMHIEPPMNFELVRKSQRWNIRCINPEEPRDNALDLTRTPIPDEHADKEPPSEICNICYDVIGTGSSPDGLAKPATSLLKCGHWFCDSCWRNHLLSRVACGTMSLTCPGHGCTGNVDFHTLLSFVHISGIKKYLQRLESEKINTSDHAVWCPIPNCGRAIVSDEAGVTSCVSKCAVCSCGVDVCFSCLQNAHWPASCRQAKKFRIKVIALKDYADLPKDFFLDPLPDVVAVEGKSCPSCKRFIEKISGCPNMTCPCGGTFCWKCGNASKPCDSHICAPKEISQVMIEEYEIQPHNMERSRHYNTALDHRRQRHYRNYGAIHSRACALAKRLSRLAVSSKQIQKQVRDLLPRIDQDLPVQSQINKFVMRMFGVKLELHHVIENTSIVMDCMLDRLTRSKLLSNVTRLQCCVGDIERSFDTHSLNDKHRMDTVMLRLFHIQAVGERLVNHIARLMGR